MEVVVEYEYLAQEDDELNLKAGDVVINVVKIQEGWCEGLLNGKKGMFPDNFVKEIKKPEKSGDQPQKRNAPGLNNIRKKLDSVINNPPSLPGPKKGIKRAKVTYTYHSQNDDELALEIGQIVEVLKQEELGWWEGNLNGQIGMFPSNFVELIEESDEAGVPERKGRKVIGVGFGPNIFDGGQIVLRPTNQGSPAQDKGQPAKIIPLKRPVLSPNADKDEKPVLRAKVIFAYKAENPDELNLNVGDVITVLYQNLEDAGWWRGDLNGKIGVFPDNFVELLPLEEKLVRLQPRLPEVPSKKEEFKDANVIRNPHQGETGDNSKLVSGLPYRPPNPNSTPKEKDDKPVVKPPCIPRKDDHLSHKPSSIKEPNKDLISLAKPAPSVTLEMFNDLQREVNQLKDQLEKMKKEHEKKLLELMSEIDEEKKTRYNIQVEMDRIKRLITSSSTS